MCIFSLFCSHMLQHFNEGFHHHHQHTALNIECVQPLFVSLVSLLLSDMYYYFLLFVLTSRVLSREGFHRAQVSTTAAITSFVTAATVIISITVVITTIITFLLRFFLEFPLPVFADARARAKEKPAVRFHLGGFVEGKLTPLVFPS